MKTYLITENQLIALLKDYRILTALIAGGVDNWENYDNAIDEFEFEYYEKIDDVSEDLKHFKIYEETVITLDDAEELYNELDNISKT